MPGRYVARTWQHDPTVDAPARYQRACRYEAFLPTRLADLSLSLEATVAGVVAEAEEAIRRLNDTARIP